MLSIKVNKIMKQLTAKLITELWGVLQASIGYTARCRNWTIEREKYFSRIKRWATPWFICILRSCGTLCTYYTLKIENNGMAIHIHNLEYNGSNKARLATLRRPIRTDTICFAFSLSSSQHCVKLQMFTANIYKKIIARTCSRQDVIDVACNLILEYQS